MDTRFNAHYLLHDRGALEDGKKIAEIVARAGINFHLLQPPEYHHGGRPAMETYQWLRRNVVNNSVVCGIGLGGLLAARLQEEFPTNGISVVAINSPTTEGGVTVSYPIYNRVAIYSSAYLSSAYPPIKGYNWSLLTPQAYDMPMLVHGVKNVKFGLSYLLLAYMLKENIAAKVSAFAFVDSDMDSDV